MSQFDLDRTDNTTIRYYLGNKLRQYDLGYLNLATDDTPFAIAIPPEVDQFIVDTYCSANATKASCFAFSISK